MSAAAGGGHAAAAAAHSAAVAAAPWRSLLQRSLSQNAALPYARYLQLATVRPDGRPACRTVVFRGFLENGDDLTFVTDRRSRKVAELAAAPGGAAEVCWYFPTTREQFRLSGAVRVVAEAEADPALAAARQAAWARMSDAGRSQFVWPHPGLPRLPADEALFLLPAPDGAGAAAPDFCLGVLRVSECDHIDLFKNTRTVYTRRQEGQGQGQGQQQQQAASGGAGAGAGAAGAAGAPPGEEGRGESGGGWAVENVNP